MEGKVSEKNELQELYGRLTNEEKRVFIRKFLDEVGRSVASFYVCLRNDSFRPLERKLFLKMAGGQDGMAEEGGLPG